MDNFLVRKQMNVEDEGKEQNYKKKDKNEDQEDEPDFMDNTGQLWDFECQVRNSQHLEEWCHRMGGMRIEMENKKMRQFDCPFENCEFQAIFLKSVSIIYSKNAHNHGLENEKDEAENEEKVSKYLILKVFSTFISKPQKYFNHLGILWRFHAKVGKNAQASVFRREFGPSDIKKTQLWIFDAMSEKNATDWKMPIQSNLFEGKWVFICKRAA